METKFDWSGMCKGCGWKGNNFLEDKYMFCEACHRKYVNNYTGDLTTEAKEMQQYTESYLEENDHDNDIN